MERKGLSFITSVFVSAVTSVLRMMIQEMRRRRI